LAFDACTHKEYGSPEKELQEREGSRVPLVKESKKKVEEAFGRAVASDPIASKYVPDKNQDKGDVRMSTPKGKNFQ
jgi:hypothetical protein